MRHATHEAGHAVAALRMGIGFEEIFLRNHVGPDGLAAGVGVDRYPARRMMMYDRSRQEYSEKEAIRVSKERQAIVCYGGPVAEALCLGGFDTGAARRDLSDAREELAQHYSAEHIPGVETRLLIRTAKMLARRDFHIRALAAELEERRNMSQTLVRKVLRGQAEFPFRLRANSVYRRIAEWISAILPVEQAQ